MRVHPQPRTGLSQFPWNTPEEEDDLEMEMKQAEEKEAQSLSLLLAPETTHYGSRVLEDCTPMSEDEDVTPDEDETRISIPPSPSIQEEAMQDDSALLAGMVLDAYFQTGDPNCCNSKISVYDDIAITFIKSNGEADEQFHQKCVLEHALGSGQFSDVYKATLNEDPHPVAVKILKPSLTTIMEKAFEREVQALKATIGNSGTLDIIGYRGYPHFWVITPMMQGGNLHNLVERRKLSVDEIIDISSQIVRVMDSLHRQGIMHRDLTPENLLFKNLDDLEICLGDFGLAEFVQVSGYTSQAIYLSPNGHPRYRAPEVSQGRYSYAAEVYNFGSCLYEMLAGSKPLQDIPDIEVGKLIQRGLHPMLPHHKGETVKETGLVELVGKCWQDQSLRPSWMDIANRLEQLRSTD